MPNFLTDNQQELETYFLGRNDKINRWGNIIASFQALPGLVGFWPMGSVQRSTGAAYDLSGQGRTLAYNGNPAYSIVNTLVPHIDLDGTDDFLSRADETDLDILGTEVIYNSAVRGLTIGGWFWIDNFDAVNGEGLMAKDNPTGGQRSYLLGDLSGTLLFNISTDGSTLVGTSSSVAVPAGVWFFAVGRYAPGAEVAIFLNGTKTGSNIAGVPASVFNGTAAFEIGRAASTNVACLDGRACLCFLCANAHPDALINALYQQGRVLFGV